MPPRLYLTSVDVGNVQLFTNSPHLSLDLPPSNYFSLRSRDPLPGTPPLTPPWKFPVWGGVIGALSVLVLCILCSFICSGLNRHQNQREAAKLRKQGLEDGQSLVEVQRVSVEERVILEGEAMPGNQTNANWNLDGALGQENDDVNRLQRPKKALVKGRLPQTVQFQESRREISVAQPNAAVHTAASISQSHIPSTHLQHDLGQKSDNYNWKGKGKETENADSTSAPPASSHTLSSRVSDIHGDIDASLHTVLQPTPALRYGSVSRRRPHSYVHRRSPYIQDPRMKVVVLEVERAEQERSVQAARELVVEGIKVRDFAVGQKLSF